MEINAKLNGMEALDAAVENARKCAADLHRAVSEINTALSRLGLEISQPSE